MLACALVLLATGARAHELTCRLSLARLGEQGKVIGTPGTVLELDRYPALIQLNFTVVNDIATKGSTAQAVLIWEFPYPFLPPPPFTVPPGGSLSSAIDGVVGSREQCLAFNRVQDVGEVSSAVDFTGHVIFDSGQALCTARLICGGESQTLDGGTPAIIGPNFNFQGANTP